jgi:hypothetical protein
MADQEAGRDQRAFWLLEDLDGWQYVDEGAFGHSYWLVPSQLWDSSERYRVTSTSCTCLDFAYRRASFDACKHMRALRAVLRVLQRSGLTEGERATHGGTAYAVSRAP